MPEPLPFHLRALLEIIDAPILLVQAEGVVLGANTALMRQLQLEPAALADRPLAGHPIVGRHLAELLISSPDEAAAFLRRSAGSPHPTVGALNFRGGDGTAISCRCYGNLLQPAHDGIAAIVGLRCRPRSSAVSPFVALNRRLDEMTKEITLRQRAEARLEQLNRELEARVQQEVRVREQIQERLAQSQRLEALGQLAAGVAHDFNNVLQAVSGGLALIQRRADDAPMVRQFARMAIDAADRGATITGRLLAFARQGELRAQAVDAGQLLAVLREMLAPTLGPGVAIDIGLDPATQRLYVDRGQVETVLVNLAINARDAMPEGGTLTLSAAPEAVTTANAAGLAAGDYVRLTVGDTGLGMDSATLARAAEPFFTTKPIGRGTGLGLAMARGFAQQSGGGFAITSAPGAGTVVTLWFPEAREIADDADPDRQSGAPQRQATMARVLLVDDDSLVRQVLASQLEDHGYQVIEASDGLAALARVDTPEPFDLLVTDFAMPGMNGMALLTEVRRRLPTMPALLLTGYADGDMQLALEDAPGAATALLRKPVRSDELAERAAAVLARASAEQPAAAASAASAGSGADDGSVATEDAGRG